MPVIYIIQWIAILLLGLMWVVQEIRINSQKKLLDVTVLAVLDLLKMFTSDDLENE